MKTGTHTQVPVPMATAHHQQTILVTGTGTWVPVPTALPVVSHGARHGVTSRCDLRTHSGLYLLTCACTFVFAAGGIEAVDNGEKEFVCRKAVALTELVVA